MGLAKADHDALFEDAQRVLSMADEIGGRAMASLDHLAQHLSTLENDATRALWLLIEHPAALALAEQRRFLDGQRNTRMWSGYSTISNLKVIEDDEAKEAMHTALTESPSLIISLDCIVS